uniref:Electron transfer flavoprotein subunit alpha n=1 Tax=Magnetococcus massalia (strain MO-1) TaxID=451514 RepID=A0A1S7LMN1_MAGMO|nr:Electron transfer flavoprotein alpha-subunit (Alpha-ETF) (Electron transfer flavoprotein large subunit) (ETFLS) [Candidatus Magnetococcus massalia]
MDVNNPTVLVVGELEQDRLSPVTAHAITAATQLAKGCTLLLCGEPHAEAVAQASQYAGVQSLIQLPACREIAVAENIAPAIAGQMANFTHLLAGESSWSKDLLPRVAALLQSQPLTAVVAIEDATTFVRPSHAGNALNRMRYQGSVPLIMSIRTTAFAPAAQQAEAAPITEGETIRASHGTLFRSLKPSPGERPDLRRADIVVCGGQGLEQGGNFVPLEQLADVMGAAVGATRSAVDAGLAPNDLQVGQTGKIVAPKLYIGVGLSGAIQHLAGMKDAGCIVSINKDPGAPIHAVADYRLVADLYDALPEWQQLIET